MTKHREYELRSYVELFGTRNGFLKAADAGERSLYEPAWRLYFEVLTWHRLGQDLYSKEFLELAYATLDSWRMNIRGAKLLEFNKFQENIRVHKEEFEELRNCRIDAVNPEQCEKAKALFRKLRIMKSGRQLVGKSKLMHFYLPNFIPIIDTANTIRVVRAGRYPADEAIFFSKMLDWCRNLCKDFNLKEDDQPSTPFNQVDLKLPLPKLIDDAIMMK